MQRASPVERPAALFISMGQLTTTCRMRTSGSTWSTRWRAPSPIPRRARRLQLNATMSSCPHDEQCARMKPCSGVPQLRCARKVLGINAGSPPCSRAYARNASRCSRTTA